MRQSSVLEEFGPRHHTRSFSGLTKVTVGKAERLASLVGGGLLALYGLHRPGLEKWICGALSAGLLYRAVSGHCPLYSALGETTAEHHGTFTSIPAGKGTRLEKSVLIDRPAE